MSQTIEIGMVIDDMYCIVTADCDGYFDPGQAFGPVESCYPPEGDFNAYNVQILNEETNATVIFESLSKVNQDRILKELEEVFFSNLD